MSLVDCGGPGTYSQILILKEYISRLASDLGVSEDDIYLADYFDLMGGVGFGGYVDHSVLISRALIDSFRLVALLIGYLRMNYNETVDTLLEVASAVFPEEPQQTINSDANTRELKKAVESILEARNIPLNTKMNDPQRPPTKCKVYVSSLGYSHFLILHSTIYAATSARINHPQAFRTYPSRGSSLNPTIVEAICATMVVPSHFSPVKIVPHLRQQSFIGGALGTSNPTRKLLKEASTVFGSESRVAQIISIGSGIRPVFSVGSETNEANLSRLLKDIATDCEAVAQELHTRLYRIKAYLRLNIERGMEDITIEDWSELGAIESHTGAYIAVASVSESIDISLRHLRERIGTVTLGQVSECIIVYIKPRFLCRY
jgi:hypothetical protein